jgi:hypothetical protein
MSTELRALLQECHDALCVARPDLAERISDELDAEIEVAQATRRLQRRISSQVAARAWSKRLARLREEAVS